MAKRTLIIIIIAAAAIAIGVRIWPSEKGEVSPVQRSVQGSSESQIGMIASGLDTPWEIAVLPDGDILATERPGRLKVIGKKAVTIDVLGVTEKGEGGLLGLALHPGFAANKYIYLYFTTEIEGHLLNRVVRYSFDGKTLSDLKIIVDNIPADQNHNGGRIAFGPDEYLYITTGDAGEENSAQDTKVLSGKILRVNDDGSIPAENPFGNAVYSYGHRNPQGLAWDSDGGLWATEHGRSGVQSGYDELNYITKGGNYGWPSIEGDAVKTNMKKGAINSGAKDTWAPSGLAYKEGKLYFAGLRGQALYEVPIISPGVVGKLTAHFKGEYGRLRAVVLDSEGKLLISTSNNDGRGAPKAEDDRIIKISL